MYPEGTLGVNAVRVGVTAAIVRGALVNVPAFESISGETFVACAHVRALGILAVGEFAAGVSI
jgi:hypothetical protein